MTTKAYYAAHKEESNAKSKAWHKANREHRNAVQREYRATHLEEQRQAHINWKAAHPDKAKASTDHWRANNAEHYKETQRLTNLRRDKGEALERVYRWAAKNPERYRHNVKQGELRHRARQREATIAAVDLNVIRLRDQMICGICFQPITETDLSYDHILPLAKGGSHTEANLQLAHRRCNSRKNDKVCPLLEMLGFYHLGIC